MVPMDPSRPFPTLPPPAVATFPQTGMIVPISSYQPVPPSTQSGPGPKSTGNLFPVPGVGSIVVGAPSHYPPVSSLSNGGVGVGVGIGIVLSGDSTGNGMSSSQRVPPDQQQQPIDGQGRSNATNLSSSSSSAAYIAPSSFISTPAVSQQQQFRQQDQQQGQQMPLHEVALKTVAASAIRNVGSISETLTEPPKKVRPSSRYFASPELIISFKAYYILSGIYIID